MLIVASAINGYVVAANDGFIGHVSDLLLDDKTWKIRWVVVDTGTWLTSRKVLLQPSVVAKVDYERQELSVSLTRKQIEDSPDIQRDRPVSQQMQDSLYSYYGWDPLWGGSTFGAGAIASPLSAPPYFGAGFREHADSGEAQEAEGDPHLRSIAAIKGYHVHARDGEIGHVENLLIEDATWTVHYLIIDTSNWWMGKHVLLAPYAVRGIGYAEKTVDVDVTRDAIEAGPPWDPITMIDTYYAKRLHHHYGWPGYGW